MTAEELLEMPRLRVGRRELANGEMTVLPPGGMRRGRIAAVVLGALSEYVIKHGLGYTVSSRASFILRRNPDTVRAAIGAFVQRGRDFFEGPPDLAIEVFDWNNDYPAEIARRVRDWLEAGTRMAIVILPKNQTATAYTPTSATRLTIDDTLSGGDVVPGWSLPLRELFI